MTNKEYIMKVLKQKETVLEKELANQKSLLNSPFISCKEPYAETHKVVSEELEQLRNCIELINNM